MKKIKITSILVVLFSVFMTSCSNEPIDPVLSSQLDNPSNNGSSSGGAGVFKADFSGQNWVADNFIANIYNGQIQIAGSKGTGAQQQGFAFLLNGTSIGTYDSTSNLLSFTPANSYYEYIGLNYANPTQSLGNVIVTSIDTVHHTISGTFGFTGYWSDSSVTNILPIVFSSGTFTNIPYVSQNPSTDTFFAKVDGSEFVEDNIDVSAVISQGFPDSYSIVASKNNGDNIGLRISQSLSVGTYQFTGPLSQDISSSYLLGGVLYSVDSGLITITSKTATHMNGTFSIIVKNFTTNVTKTITEGAFSVDLP
jgi:hypothetical protein